MPAKIARSAPSAAVRGARTTAAVRAARRSCQNAATAQKSTPVWGSSGESRLNNLPGPYFQGPGRKNFRYRKAARVARAALLDLDGIILNRIGSLGFWSEIIGDTSLSFVQVAWTRRTRRQRWRRGSAMVCNGAVTDDQRVRLAG